MFRTPGLVALLAVITMLPGSLNAQCLSAPPLEDCTGTEPALSDNEILLVGDKKWYYGVPAIYNSVILRGGTLVVCGELTFTNFTMDSGTVVIRPGAHLRIGGGAGIILRGNASIFNHGTFECTSNLSLDPTWATPEKPNILINARGTAFFKMSNQYLTINNPNSFFVNRGKAEFWGITTDYGAGAGSVCLGRFSETNMAWLFNNRKHTYTAPEGAACVHVFQGSQVRDTLTASANINMCLGDSHTSLPCGGCPVTGWGTPHVFQLCDGCNTITLLDLQITDLAVTGSGEKNKLSWKTNKPCEEYVFYAEHSPDGRSFESFHSFPGSADPIHVYTAVDNEAAPGTSYYRVRAVQAVSGQEIFSSIRKVESGMGSAQISITPNPFTSQIHIKWTKGSGPQSVVITSLSGAVVYSRTLPAGNANGAVVQFPASLAAGQYVLKLLYKEGVLIRQITRAHLN